MDQTRSFAWSLSKNISQLSGNNSQGQECGEIFTDLINFLNSKYRTNLSSVVNQSEIEFYNECHDCYVVWHQNLTNNEPIVYPKRFEYEFQDITQISGGSFGTVFKAISKCDKASYAVKKIRIRNQEHLTKALNEVQLLANYPKCPHIVEYKTHWLELGDKGEDSAQQIEDSKPDDSEGTSSKMELHSSDLVSIAGSSSPSDVQDKFTIPTYLYIQQELCAMSLSEAIKLIHSELIPVQGQSLPAIGQYVMSELMIEILRAIEYLHENRIIHRDLKEGNILLTFGYKSNMIKICDFGLSTTHQTSAGNRCEPSQTTSRTTGDLTSGVGTTGYIAPEALVGQAYTSRADLYSLGVIMAHMFGLKADRVIRWKKLSRQILIECDLNTTLFAKRVADDPDLKRDLVITNDYKDGTLYLLAELLDVEGDRRTSRQILDNNIQQHFVSLEDIRGSDEMRDVFAKIWTDNIMQNMRPLSSFIAYKKASNHIELKSRYTDNLDEESNVFYYNIIKRIRHLVNIERLSSNIDDINTKQFIYKIIIHAISTFENFEQSMNSIESALHKYYPGTIWKCLMCEQIGEFDLVSFHNNSRCYSVSIREDEDDEENEIKFQHFIMFEMFKHDCTPCQTVTTVQAINMNESMISEASKQIEYVVTSNLAVDKMKSHISTSWNDNYPDDKWQIIVLKDTSLFPVSTDQIICEHGTFGAFTCREYCFVISSVHLFLSPNDMCFPFITHLNTYENDQEQYVKQVLVSPETDEFDDDIYSTLSELDIKAIHKFCSSYTTKLINTFELKTAVIDGRHCIALLDYQRVGHTENNFDTTVYLKDDEGDTMKMRWKWI